jgi:hypothetical protein
MRNENINKPQNQQSCQNAVSGSAILPTEIRIGNIVKLIYGQRKYSTVIGVDSEYLYIDEITFDYTEHSEFESIPISEELLLKLNAVKLDFKDFPSFNLFGMQINFINGLWIEYVSRVEIKGLHHLQNIFFFRNSEELQISSLTDH